MPPFVPRQFQSASLDLLGNMGVVATLVVFDTPEGAAKGLELYHERDQGMVDAGDLETLSPINAPTIGDRSEAYTLVGAKEEGSPQMDAHSVAFQKGNALVFVQSYAFRNGGNVAQLIELAKQIEQRLP